ncbi:ABC transporter permease [Mycoplasma tauri]|uniref:ABC transporter permease n=1 Tax=Mycoplasma tauri TaxID=547987 RepID=A0A953T778_9MOLU|nr:ABC transporter permease [Mycoplasma tauri]MBZ4195377.1 ABC transporter permease [Mycoplasma tauri]MBZ4203976.1 ABC transporter permease [Mycoplasma tauri]MBZ4212808.1 ABC transporter permease [Mycoplasma tauri]MBZ4218469.1 ABC transporter permease [Mycoplasma tauri]MBZ4226903.1 ABC transporter permease [Mycoplasma tauri]
MTKISKWLKNNSRKRRMIMESPNNIDGEHLAPNKFLRPLAYKQWQFIGNLFEFSETSRMHNRQKPFVEFFYRFSRSFAGVFGLVTLLTLIILSIFIPMITPHDPLVISQEKRYETFFTNGHILGTDYLGRDLWARLWYGLRYSLMLSFVATFIQVIVGLFIGIMMGHFRIFDKIMTFVIKIISNVPSIIILITITIILKPTFWVMVFALSFTSWAGIANQMRSQVLRAKSFEWVSASKILGTPTHKVLLNYLPILIPLLITEIVFHIPGIILSETSLAFIGLSIPNIATLGNLISDGSKNFTVFPRYVLVPSFMLILVTTSIQLMAAAVQDSLLRQR